MRWGLIVFFLLNLAVASTANSQETEVAPSGVFLCDDLHPRCTTEDQSEYRYHQFQFMSGIGQFSGISDILENGPSLLHYQTFLAELITQRPDTNAVALWSDGKSVVDKGRVWGGFISARSELPDGQDSQLIGLEIDVLNDGLPGRAPNNSKVGLQIVGFGRTNTNAIEILTHENKQGGFLNGINIQPNAIVNDGTVLGLTPQDILLGINFLDSKFADAAFLVSPNTRIAFRQTGTQDASIWRDEFANGHLVFNVGPAGLRIANNSNSRNLLYLRDDGSISSDSLVVQRYAPYVVGFVALSLLLHLVLATVLFRTRRLLGHR